MSIPIKPTLTAPPTAPQRTDPPDTFANRADAYLVWQNGYRNELVAGIDWQNTVFTATETQATNAANSATASANSATASANSATASANSATEAEGYKNTAETAAAAAQSAAGLPSLVGNGGKVLKADNDEQGVGWGLSGLNSLPVYVNTSASGTIQLDFSQYSIFEIEASGDVTLEVIGLPTDNRSAGTLYFKNEAGFTASFPDFVFDRNYAGIQSGVDYAYSSNNFSLSSQGGNASGIAFNQNGSKLFMSAADQEKVHQYSLSTPYDISTMTYDNASLDVSINQYGLTGLAFSPDGTRMYVCEVNVTQDKVYQYNLSTGYDLITASYSGKNYYAGGNPPQGVAISGDGTKLHVVTTSDSLVRQHTLSTPFDLSTASHDNTDFDVSAQLSSVTDIKFSIDGAKMFLCSSTSQTIYQYNLTTPYNVATATYTGVNFYVGGQEGAPAGLEFSDDEAKMYAAGGQSKSIYEYNRQVTINRLDCVQRQMQMLVSGGGAF